MDKEAHKCLLSLFFPFTRQLLHHSTQKNVSVESSSRPFRLLVRFGGGLASFQFLSLSCLPGKNMTKIASKKLTCTTLFGLCQSLHAHYLQSPYSLSPNGTAAFLLSFNSLLPTPILF